MQLLSLSVIGQVSGGHQVSKEEVLRSMEHYSFLFTLVGGMASAIYGFCTNDTVITIVGTTRAYASTFPSVFFIGLGVSWAIGAAVGLVAGVYNAELKN